MAREELTADDIDLAAREFWAQSAAERDAAFDVLRRERPVARFRAADSPLLPPEPDSPGFWAVTRHADVRMISRTPEVFCSGKGVILDDVPEMLLEASQSFLAMDAPRHTKIRGLVQKAFTPRQMRRIEDEIADQARLAHAADDMVGRNDDEVVGLDREPIDALTDGLVTIHAAAEELIAARRAKPTEDLMSALVQAGIDGEQLTDEDIGAFLVLRRTRLTRRSRRAARGGLLHRQPRAIVTKVTAARVALSAASARTACSRRWPRSRR